MDDNLTSDLAEHAVNCLAVAELERKKAAETRSDAPGWPESDRIFASKKASYEETAKRYEAYAKYATAKPVSRFAYHGDNEGMSYVAKHQKLMARAVKAERAQLLDDDNNPVE
jgi:hypothetical protein